MGNQTVGGKETVMQGTTRFNSNLEASIIRNFDTYRYIKIIGLLC